MTNRSMVFNRTSEDWQAEVDLLTLRMTRIEIQRDALLAAAKAALPYLCDPAANLGREALETKLRQAIAAAEGR